MKLSQTEYNPLPRVLECINSDKPEILTQPTLECIFALLKLGGIEAETLAEKIKCLELLDELGLVNFTSKKRSQDTIFYINRTI